MGYLADRIWMMTPPYRVVEIEGETDIGIEDKNGETVWAKQTDEDGGESREMVLEMIQGLVSILNQEEEE